MAIRYTGPLSFDEYYAERIWGGRKLESVYGKSLPPNIPVGEAWLVSDHPQHVSTVTSGPEHIVGRTLRELLEEDAPAILGTHASLTVHGRFPLLLKILDAADYLSVQVHPDDAAAARLGEPDVGKTEMWHVLEADPGSQLICGLNPAVDDKDLRGLVAANKFQDALVKFAVSSGTSVFVPAGTVHAIGSGILLAEIQQNSDVTYRIHDWNRLQEDGTPRTLHIDKSLCVIRYGSRHTGPVNPLTIHRGSVSSQVLAACRYFAAERTELASGIVVRDTCARSFHLLLATTGSISVQAGDASQTLARGRALLVPGSFSEFSVTGTGVFLDYYVPDLVLDVLKPLRKEGYDDDEIFRLGGDPMLSDLSKT